MKMTEEMRCGTAVRTKHRKRWFVPLAGTLVAGAALLVLGMYDGRSAQAQSTEAGLDAGLVAAGDIASCDSRGDEATARLLDSIQGTVIAAGDNAYERGSLSEFNDCYDPSWGRYKGRTKAVVGNHEYETPGASGHFDYFGRHARDAAGEQGNGYYSFDRGEWHIVALNSECDYVRGGCDRESPMLKWLKSDLAANPARCTLAYFHRPLFSSGQNGNDATMRPIWNILYRAEADVVIAGHDHIYERFARQTPSGTPTKRGIREFVVGTGGASHGKIRNVKANSQVRNANTYGVLKLTLRPTNYSWEFVPVAGKTFTDSGNNHCSR